MQQTFEEHGEESKYQVRRLDQAFKGLGEPSEEKSCTARAGLVAEARETLAVGADLVFWMLHSSSRRRRSHYEMAGYGSVRTFARILIYSDAARLIETILKEELRTA